ncbi:hypothetical protein [Streptomyces sp. NPDC086777]|uniref:hypothetical protein n=1 Tax=Streptomyces sp. NPDC086777 TaxID=3154866 RepID=UPI0034506833
MSGQHAEAVRHHTGLLPQLIRTQDPRAPLTIAVAQRTCGIWQHGADKAGLPLPGTLRDAGAEALPLVDEVLGTLHRATRYPHLMLSNG